MSIFLSNCHSRASCSYTDDVLTSTIILRSHQHNSFVFANQGDWLSREIRILGDGESCGYDSDIRNLNVMIVRGGCCYHGDIAFYNVLFQWNDPGMTVSSGINSRSDRSDVSSIKSRSYCALGDPRDRRDVLVRRESALY